MRSLHALLALTLVAALGACDSAPSPTGSTSPTGSPSTTPTAATPGPSAAPSGEPATTPPADFPQQVVEATGDQNLKTLARALLTKTVAADGVRIVLHWQDAKLGPLTPQHILGRQKIDWAKTVASLKLKISPPGMPERRLAVKTVERQPEEAVLAISTSLVVRFDVDGVKRRKGTESWPWESPAKDLFAKPGSYSVKVAGTLALQRTEVPFESAPLVVEIVAGAPTFKPLAELETVAAQHVKTRLKLSDTPRPSKETVADAAGNRVVRFAVDAESGRYDRQFVEVVVDPAGTVLAFDSRTVFTCIAAGTAVATPTGSRPIETIQVGDALWGYDPPSQRRVLTTVRAVMPAEADRVVALGAGLVATPSHPIYANGRWTSAGDLRAGDQLLGLDGAVQPLANAHTQARRVRVFDLTVDWPHTFFAGGLLVHNKAAQEPRSISLHQDDWARLWHRPSTLKPAAPAK